MLTLLLLRFDSRRNAHRPYRYLRLVAQNRGIDHFKPLWQDPTIFFSSHTIIMEKCASVLILAQQVSNVARQATTPIFGDDETAERYRQLRAATLRLGEIAAARRFSPRPSLLRPAPLSRLLLPPSSWLLLHDFTRNIPAELPAVRRPLACVTCVVDPKVKHLCFRVGKDIERCKHCSNCKRSCLSVSVAPSRPRYDSVPC